MKLVAILLILLVLAACDQKAAATGKDKSAALTDGNTMSCVAGDLKLASAGAPQVEIGGFGIHGI